MARKHQNLGGPEAQAMTGYVTDYLPSHRLGMTDLLLHFNMVLKASLSTSATFTETSLEHALMKEDALMKTITALLELHLGTS